MSDQPATSNIRAVYVMWLMRHHDSYMSGVPAGDRVAELEARFNRWLADVQADAWDEGFDAGHETARAVQPGYPAPPPNPHRQEARDE